MQPAPVTHTVKILEKTYPKLKYYLNFSNPLELMVAAILSAQVRDTAVNAATPALFAKYKSAGDYARAAPDELIAYIKNITFTANKAKNIIAACKILQEKHAGKVPRTMEELTELPGIGRKTANAIMQNAFDIVEGIVVDVHGIRICYRLGWTKNKNPEKIEQDLMKIIPKNKWKKLPHLIKDHGRAVCRAQVPYCSKCVLTKLCPKQGVTKKF